MIDVANFKTTTALADFSVKQINEETDFICDEVFVPHVISKSQFKYYQYDNNIYRNVDSRKDSKATADFIDYGVFTASDNAVLHKLAGEVDPADERDADDAVADMRFDVAQGIMHELLLRREIEMVTLVAASGNYPAALTSTLGSAATWASSGGDPEADRKTAGIAVRGRCGKDVNAVAMSWTTLQHLKQSEALKDRLKYTSGDSISEEQIKRLLMVDFLHICKARKNTAIEGTADSMSDVWDDDVLFYVKDTSKSLRGMSYGRNFMVNSLYTHEYLDDTRGGPAGRISILETGWEYKLRAAAVASSSDGDFIAGYWLDNAY